MHTDSADVEHEDAEDCSKRLNHTNRIELYKNICKLENKSLLY
jgi:hypothetical protein